MPSKPKSKAVEQMLDRAITELLAEIAGSLSGEPQHVDPQKLDLVERLQRVRQALPPAPIPPRKPWSLLAIGIGVLLIAGALLFLPLPHTEVEVEASTGEVAFHVPRNSTLLDGLSVQDLTVARADSISASDIPALTEHLAGKPFLKITRGNDRCSPGASRPDLSLGALSVPAGSLIRIQKSPDSPQARISFSQGGGQTKEILISVDGPFRLAGSEQCMEVAAPQSITVSGEDLELTFTVMDRSSASPAPLAAILPNLEIDGISFERPEARSLEASGIGRPLSMLTQGSVWLYDLGDAERKLRRGQPLSLTGARGLLRTLEIGEKGISVDFSGTVKDLRAGFGESARSLMPTLLEWVRANPKISLMWGAVVWLAGAIPALLSWRKKLEEK